MDQLKVCSKCRESKAHSEFTKNNKSKDGLSYECKVCSKHNYLKNKDKKLKYQREHYKQNKQDKIAYQKQYTENNREKVAQYQKDYRQKTLNKLKEYERQYYEQNKQDKLAYKKQYARNNRDKINEYVKHRYATDPEYRAKCILRRELTDLFKLSGLKKDKRSIELLGVSWTEAYTRLINTLPEGYTEQDWLDGKLHVDHKIPISWYERLYGTLTEDLIKRVNHISNLQLLPANDNLSKSNKYGHGINNEIILYEDWVITEQLSTISH